MKPIIVDAHLDIAWNKLALDREFTASVADKRTREGASPAHGEGHALVGLPDLLAGNVRIVFATLYVSPERPDRPPFGKTYSTPQHAHDQAMEQLTYYGLLAADSRISLITTREDIDPVIHSDKPMVGLVLLMEGADPIVEPDQVREWFDAGVRIVGTSWSQTRYAGGTRAPGGLTPLGRELLPKMEQVGMILDTSHMAEQSFFEALDIFHGTVIASHSNARAFVNTDRQLSDEMIRAVVDRDGVIGIVTYNRFLKEGWDKSAAKGEVTLADVVKHIKHMCDLAGDTRHVGIGTDFDGGFGVESAPLEIDSVADLYKVGDALTAASFNDQDIANILGLNWIRLLRRGLPA